MSRKFLISAVLCVAASMLQLAVPVAVAGEGVAGYEPRHRFSVGIGQWGARSPLQGTPQDDAQTGFLPWISYENHWLSVDPSALAVRVFAQDSLRIEALVAPRWLFIDPRDSTLHNDLHRRTSIDAGARTTAVAGAAQFALTYRGDVSGRVNGHEVTAEAGVGLPLPGGGELGVKGGVYWRDDDLNTSLYGVFPGEAREDRPAYGLAGGFTPFAGIQIRYPVIGGLQVMLAAEAEYLPDGIRASPILARRVVPSAMMGLFYGFEVK